jgi:hypothetical protein
MQEWGGNGALKGSCRQSRTLAVATSLHYVSVWMPPRERDQEQAGTPR